MEDLIFLYIIIGLFALFLEYLIANKFEQIANEKGYSGFFWWCFWFNIIGYIMVAALPDRTAQDQIVSAIHELKENKEKQPQFQAQQNPQQSYWNNNLPPL